MRMINGVIKTGKITNACTCNINRLNKKSKIDCFPKIKCQRSIKAFVHLLFDEWAGYSQILHRWLCWFLSLLYLYCPVHPKKEQSWWYFFHYYKVFVGYMWRDFDWWLSANLFVGLRFISPHTKRESTLPIIRQHLDNMVTELQGLHHLIIESRCILHI